MFEKKNQKKIYKYFYESLRLPKCVKIAIGAASSKLINLHKNNLSYCSMVSCAKKKSNPEHCLDFALLDNNLLCTYAYNYFLVTFRMRGVIYFNLHCPYGFVSSLLRSLSKYFIFRHGILKLMIRNLESNLSLECRMCHCLSSLHVL